MLNEFKQQVCSSEKERMEGNVLSCVLIEASIFSNTLTNLISMFLSETGGMQGKVLSSVMLDASTS